MIGSGVCNNVNLRQVKHFYSHFPEQSCYGVIYLMSSLLKLIFSSVGLRGR